MKRDVMWTITSMLLVVLLVFHLTDDIVLGMEPGSLSNLYAGVLISFLWLYATLILGGRRPGYVIVLLGSLVGAYVPYVHFSGRGVARIAKSSGGFFFVWTLFAIGIVALLSVTLSARGLWRLRRTASE